MGLQLWYSKNTGIRRKGTTFSELQDIFISSITTNFIFEPLACCHLHDNNFDVIEKMSKLDFDILGVAKDGKTIGFIQKQNIHEDKIERCLQQFNIDNLISDSTPISELMDILLNKDYVFVIGKNDVCGIVTKADINKPIVRIYIFGIISLFELHINYWINHYHADHSWREKLKANRLEAANKVFEERKGNNEQLTLLECLQISDKKEILRNCNDFLLKFNYSKIKFKDLLEKIEKIRNELAHSQNSIISNIKWENFVSAIQSVKEFLTFSEIEIIK